MKKWFVLLGVVIALLAGGFYALSYFGVRFINAELKRKMGPGLTVSEIRIGLTHLYAGGIRYEDPQVKKSFLQIDEMRVYPALLSWIRGELRIRELAIVRPSFYFSRSREGAFGGPWPGGDKKGQSREAKSFQMRIDRLRIEEGTLDFEDRKVDGPPAKIVIRNLELDIRDMQYPSASIHSPIMMKGKMVGAEKEGDIETGGWIDFSNLDMDALLTVREVDVKSFEPYYRKRVSAEIESGYLTMQSKITIKKRIIDAPGDLELTHFRVKEGGGSILWIPATTVVSVLKDKGNRIKVNFHVKGNLDDPQFKLQENVMRRMAISFAEALGLPIKVVGEEVLRGTFKGAEGLAEGLKSLQELFRPRKEKKE